MNTSNKGLRITSSEELLGFENLDSLQKEPTTVKTVGITPPGKLPLTEQMLLEEPSGNLFGLTHNVAMGWKPEETTQPAFMILSTQGGIRSPDGSPIALGLHTGHW